MLQSFLIFSLFVFVFGSSFGEVPIVELSYGKILGREDVTFANTTYYAFQKIPYATPPIGALRFKAPQPPQKWDDILDATNSAVSCMQLRVPPLLSFADSEDCLYLNIYTTQLPQNDQNVSLPVMILIHGGSFLSGTGVWFPPDLFVDNGVILVTINYRLGPFGFLSTQDDVIPGNFGLKDQFLAIKWVHENIQFFGGNPDKITIFGQSAGSTSIGFQLLNQNSEGLYSSAILESGSPISPYAYQRNSREIAFATAAILNSTFVDSDDSEALLEFLLTVDASDLDAAAEEYVLSVATPWEFNLARQCYYAPVIEAENPDAFITKKMYGLLQSGNFVRVPTMIGFCSEESLAFNEDPKVLQSSLELWDQNLDWIIPDDMLINDPKKRSKMAIQIRDIYTNGEPFSSNLAAGIKYSSDHSFTRPSRKHGELISQYTETYFYQFSYDGEIGGSSVHYEGAERVGHIEEGAYLICSKDGCNRENYPQSDQITANRLIKLWTNFAKYQNPTPETSDLLQNITWPQVSTDNGDFLYLNINDTLEIMNHPKEETYRKWVELYDSLEFSDFDTY